jgi:hypothetical protein
MSIGAEQRSILSIDSSSPGSPPLPGVLPDVNPITGPAIDLYEEGFNDPVYQAKARILNHAIQDIGMGRYQVSGYLNECLSQSPIASNLR